MIKFFICFFAFLFYACTDSEFKTSEETFLEDFIYGFSENEDIDLTTNPNDSFLVTPNQKMTFRMVSKKNGEIIPNKQLDNFYSFRYWEVLASVLTEEEIKVQFINPGIEKICHLSIDLFSDSIYKCSSVFINTPLEISEQKPLNNTNDLNPNDDSLLFSWNISGIDSFETPECSLYISSSEKFENSFKAQVSCLESKKISIEKLFRQFADTSLFYWKLKAKTLFKDSGTFLTSEIFRFRFASKENKTVLLIPVFYDIKKFETVGVLEIFGKDSLVYSEKFSGDTLFSVSVLEPDSLYKIKIRETLRTDYRADSASIILKENLYTVSDTLILKDKIAPEAFPLKNAFPIKDSVCFFVAEKGSGINALKTRVVLTSSADTLKYKYLNSKISFFTKCTDSCFVKIDLEDNSKNKSPDKKWKLEFSNDSVFVSGPFFEGYE